MSVRFTDAPSTTVPGEVIGKPVRIPAVLLCQAAGPGQRSCGKVWTANSEREFPEKAAERREHERTCRGGLVVSG